jgi:hypothetical protein
MASDGRRDFDFIFGRWQIANRRLVDQTDPDCTEWIEFDTESEAYPIFDGLAHLDLIRAGADAPNGPWQGLTLRQFDPESAVWRIWWATSRRPGYVDPPLTGRFTDGVGHFEGADEIAGRPIKLRFEWRNPTHDSARWMQSFSFDGGVTWLPNWIMDFSRKA